MPDDKPFRPSPLARPGCRRLAMAASAAALLAGCQTTLSLEEARKVTANFSGMGFVPPPRTIKDITAIPDEQAITDPEESARQVANAGDTPPAAGDAATLARLYYARGKAGGVAGPAQLPRLPDDDGPLTMGEILDLDPDADWVVLSACDTGFGADAGAEAVSGLGQAFFYAGGTIDPATGKTVFSCAHPIFWAPFTLIGDGGVGKSLS